MRGRRGAGADGEANDNHAEEHTVAEFIEFCINGRTASSGKWTSKGTGKYLEGGKAAGGMLVDQRFCPRIVEGELRYNCVGPKLVGIIHKKPAEGGISAVSGTGSVYTFYGPDEPKFKNLTNNFLTKDMDKIMPSLGLDEPIPLWWTTDFILASRGHPGLGGEVDRGRVQLLVRRHLRAFRLPQAGDANACWDDIPAEDKGGDELRRHDGQGGLDILDKKNKFPVDISSPRRSRRRRASRSRRRPSTRRPVNVYNRTRPSAARTSRRTAAGTITCRLSTA